MPASGKQADSSVKPPNILILMTDQQRFDSLGCYGSIWTRTHKPVSWASQGNLFRNCCMDTPLRTPARTSLITGKQLPDQGGRQLHEVLPSEEINSTEQLQAFGYRTALFGKLHVSGRIEEALGEHPLDRFFAYKFCCEPTPDLDQPLNGHEAWPGGNHPDHHDVLKAKSLDPGPDPVEASTNHWVTGASSAELGTWMPSAKNLASRVSGCYDAFRDFRVRACHPVMHEQDTPIHLIKNAVELDTQARIAPGSDTPVEAGR